MNLARRLVRQGLEGVDVLYRRLHDLQPVGPLLFVSVQRHRGAPLELADGTHVERGAAIGRLHFNNARAAAVQADGRSQAGVRFARLLIQSFLELANRARGDRVFHDIQLYEGVTWFRPHGDAVGFQTEPLPPGLRRRLLTSHFRLLIWGFAPTAQAAAMTEVEPRLFRITRRALLEDFARTRRTSGA